jgi:hypothetical protein
MVLLPPVNKHLRSISPQASDREINHTSEVLFQAPILVNTGNRRTASSIGSLSFRKFCLHPIIGFCLKSPAKRDSLVFFLPRSAKLKAMQTLKRIVKQPRLTASGARLFKPQQRLSGKNSLLIPRHVEFRFSFFRVFRVFRGGRFVRLCVSASRRLIPRSNRPCGTHKYFSGKNEATDAAYLLAFLQNSTLERSQTKPERTRLKPTVKRLKPTMTPIQANRSQFRLRRNGFHTANSVLMFYHTRINTTP